MGNPEDTGLEALERASACLARAQGCLVGQIAGDSLGSLVEFWTADEIEHRYPGGPRLLSDGGVWDTIAGQPTDDSELALALARSLAKLNIYSEDAVAQTYAAWYQSEPFDIGETTRVALSAAASRARVALSVAATAKEAANRSSQANGALMRISPLGILGVSRKPTELAAWARTDASLTHPHMVCQESNVAFTAAIAFAIRTGEPPERIHHHALETLQRIGTRPVVQRCLREAESRPPVDYERNQGWVLIALQNAFYQLLHAPSLEEGVVDTVRHGGDTDTNGAIAGALLGAMWGLPAVPQQWLDSILDCRPEGGREGVHRPRRREYWPVDVLELAARVLGTGDSQD
jgi:ADP-ribosylglycohydrolase